MAKLAQPPFENGYYLDGLETNQPLILWERGIYPLSWHGDDIQWCYYNHSNWIETLNSDAFMSEKKLTRL
jgi:hypothetical protein